MAATSCTAMPGCSCKACRIDRWTSNELYEGPRVGRRRLLRPRPCQSARRSKSKSRSSEGSWPSTSPSESPRPFELLLREETFVPSSGRGPTVAMSFNDEAGGAHTREMQMGSLRIGVVFDRTSTQVRIWKRTADGADQILCERAEAPTSPPSRWPDSPLAHKSSPP